MSATIKKESINIRSILSSIPGILDKIKHLWHTDHETGWKDLTSPLTTAGVPTANAPTLASFGTTTTGDAYEAMSFANGDYAYCLPFHINHDINNGAKALLHIHWSTNGTSTAQVDWQFTVRRALGHGQATFANTEATYTVSENASGTAWQHMVTEVDISNALLLSEPDELILVTLKRTSATNANAVFGLYVDLHYESSREATPNRAPNFYDRTYIHHE